MSIAATIRNTVNRMPPGKVFGYRAFKFFDQSPETVIKAVNRMVDSGSIERLSKGKFYVPEQGYFGLRKLADKELLKTILYKGGKRRGYVTGAALYNQLGLTTQLPKTVTVAVNGSRQIKDFGTLKVITKTSKAPVNESNFKLLQYLDVLNNASKIMDADINRTFKVMAQKITDLDLVQKKTLAKLAVDYYGARTRATLAMIYTRIGFTVPAKLVKSINPITTYKLKLDEGEWPEAIQWNIT